MPGGSRVIQHYVANLSKRNDVERDGGCNWCADEPQSDGLRPPYYITKLSSLMMAKAGEEASVPKSQLRNTLRGVTASMIMVGTCMRPVPIRE